jgi:hypothetical protein
MTWNIYSYATVWNTHIPKVVIVVPEPHSRFWNGWMDVWKSNEKE